MDKTTAKQIITDNHNAANGSFIYLLHEKSRFSPERFWDYYDSVAALVTTDDKTPELTKLITDNYQRILKYLVFHLDPDDDYVIKDFPKNYMPYIERLEYVLMAYHTIDTRLISEDIFELKR
jgi:hypothetical protein